MKTIYYIAFEQRRQLTGLVVFFFILLVLSTVSEAQQHSANSLFNYNRLDFNPAVAGASDNVPITLYTRQQWMGFNNAPRSQYISSHGYLPYNIGLGGVIFNNITGPTRQTGAKIAFSTHFNLNETNWFSLGISGEFYENLFDVTKLKTGIPNDPAIQTEVEQKLAPDASAGVLFYAKNYFAGVSVTNLLRSSYDLFNDYNNFDNPIERTLYVTGGYYFELEQDFAYKPTVLVKKTIGIPWQVDFSNQIIYNDMFWGGLGFRSNLDGMLMLGVRYKIYELAYSYDFNFNEIKEYTSGSQEIILRFNLNNAIREEGSSYGRKGKMFNW